MWFWYCERVSEKVTPHVNIYLCPEYWGRWSTSGPNKMSSTKILAVKYEYSMIASKPNAMAAALMRALNECPGCSKVTDFVGQNLLLGIRGNKVFALQKSARCVLERVRNSLRNDKEVKDILTEYNFKYEDLTIHVHFTNDLQKDEVQVVLGECTTYIPDGESDFIVPIDV